MSNYVGPLIKVCDLYERISSFEIAEYKLVPKLRPPTSRQNNEKYVICETPAQKTFRSDRSHTIYLQDLLYDASKLLTVVANGYEKHAHVTLFL